MSRGLDKWLTPIALFLMVNYLVQGDDDDNVVKEVLSVANDDGDDDDDISDLLQQVKSALKRN